MMRGRSDQSRDFLILVRDHFDRRPQQGFLGNASHTLKSQKSICIDFTHNQTQLIHMGKNEQMGLICFPLYRRDHVPQAIDLNIVSKRRKLVSHELDQCIFAARY
jgi:hypothetical protein